MVMIPDSSDRSRYKWRAHLIAASTSHLIFAAPSLFLLAALGVTGPEFALFLFLIFLLASPLAATITWLIDKGSKGGDGVAAIKVLGVMPARLYGLIVGGLLGNDIGGPVAGIVGAILLYLVGRFIGVRFGSSMAMRIANSVA